MVNPWAGEVEVVLNGEPHRAKLTLGALAELETALQVGSLVDLAQRFECGKFSARDVIVLLVAGLRGGGWQGNAEAFCRMEIKGGPIEAARLAAELLARAFTFPDET
ncbi:gene transfer agent family protein [Thioclava sp. FR2]|uniref:gene transfer agent family protein n=1 Tax=Thioclava sp. FR2 TaxID=3445780 RepID=UPI003EB7AE29